ncbi:MAG: cyclic nucleotide-binding domain-containing protein [Myxococcota bacterium]
MITKRDASTAAFLSTVPVFHDLKGPSLEVLFEFLEERRWNVGDHICDEGDDSEASQALFIIREGEVEVLRKSSRGVPQSIVKLGPGECFGEMTLIELQPRSATCIVRRNAVTYSLTNRDLWNLLRFYNFAYVIILQNICRMLSRRLRKADSRIVEFLDAMSEAQKARMAAKKTAAPKAKATAKKPTAKKKKK